MQCLPVGVLRQDGGRSRLQRFHGAGAAGDDDDRHVRGAPGRTVGDAHVGRAPVLGVGEAQLGMLQHHRADALGEPGVVDGDLDGHRLPGARRPRRCARAHDVGLAPIVMLGGRDLARAHDPELGGLADALRRQPRVQAAHARHRLAVEADDDVADVHAGGAGRSVGIEAHDHDAAPAGQRVRLGQRLVEAQRLQAEPEIAAPDAAIGQQLGRRSDRSSPWG